MTRAVFVLLPLLLGQDDASTFTSEQRLTAAYYTLSPDARPAVDALEMGKAGVEIALVAFQGDAKALDPLIAVLDDLEKDHKSRPRLAPLVQPGATPDLSAADEFYARVPKRHWAQIDGRPVVWLAPAPRGAAVDRAPMAAAISRLQRPPYLVAETSWKDAPADRSYALGATRGFTIDLPVVSAGPQLD